MAENNLCFVVLLIAILAVYQYFLLKFPDITKKLDTNTFIDVPYDVKCFFKESGCEDGDVDGISIVYCAIFFMFGLVMPNKYMLSVFISVGNEFVAPMYNRTPRYIVHPLLNFTAYSLGSFASNYFKK